MSESPRKNTRRTGARDVGTRAAGSTSEPGPGPAEESGIDGHGPAIGAAVTALLGRSLQRDEKGRFVHGPVKTGERSEALWSMLAPVKAEIVAAVRRQLAAEGPDPAPVLLNLIDAYAEASLLRRSTFLQLVNRGGPVTGRGKVRGLLQAWGAFFDRELRAAERLGLANVPRLVDETPAAWLARVADERRRTGQAEQQAAHQTTDPGATDPTTD